MHITEEYPEDFIGKKGILSSELISVPPLITSKQNAERIKTYQKSEEELYKLKKMKRNLNPEAAQRAFMKYATENKIRITDNISLV